MKGEKHIVRQRIARRKARGRAAAHCAKAPRKKNRKTTPCKEEK
jgi:hypothetical protein